MHRGCMRAHYMHIIARRELPDTTLTCHRRCHSLLATAAVLRAVLFAPKKGPEKDSFGLDTPYYFFALFFSPKVTKMQNNTPACMMLMLKTSLVRTQCLMV